MSDRHNLPVVENRLWQPEEALPRADLAALQADRLRALVARVGAVPFYNEQFRRLALTPDAIRSPADLRRLPFTTKEDLRQHYPLGFLAVPRGEVVLREKTS